MLAVVLRVDLEDKAEGRRVALAGLEFEARVARFVAVEAVELLERAAPVLLERGRGRRDEAVARLLAEPQREPDDQSVVQVVLVPRAALLVAPRPARPSSQGS